VRNYAPPALVTGDLHPSTPHTHSDEEAEAILHKFPEPELSIILWLTDLAVDVVANKDVNLMTSKNMSIVVAPNLYR